MRVEIERRALLKAAGAVLAGSAAPAGAAGASGKAQGIIVFDPALPGGRALAKAGNLTGARLIAVKGDRIAFWRALEAKGAPVGGVTSWSDYVLFRGLAAEEGLRVRGERQLTRPSGDLFVWRLA